MPYEYINENSSRYIPDEARGEINYEKMRQQAGNTNEAKAQRERSQPSYTSPVAQAYAGTGATYGLAADVALNPGTKLYVPGQTQLGTKDVFLGGTGTGVTNAMLGGATRVYGNTAQDTANAYSKYLSSQLPKTPTAQYVTNPKGQTTSQYSQGTSTYNVLPGSVQDPLNKNYNALVANSNGKITLADLDSSSPTGLSPAYNGTPGSGAPNSPGYAIRAAGGVYQSPATQTASQAQPRSESQSQPQSQSQSQQQPQYQTQSFQPQQSQLNEDPLLSIIGNDPEAMAYYNKAKQSAQLGSRNAMETLNARGILNSSVTGDAVTELEQQAMTGILPQLYAFQEQKRQQAKQNAYNRMVMLGYADNEVAKILGIPVGTPSAAYSAQNFNQGIAATNVTGYAPKVITDLYPAYAANNPTYDMGPSGTGGTYGLAADVALNPGSQLFIPGKTRLTANDVFLGGAGTGVTDDMLGGATRIAGNTAQDTAAKYNAYRSGQTGQSIQPQYQPQPQSQTQNDTSVLPPSLAAQYLGATDVVSLGDGAYKFISNNGSPVYVYQP